jgi:hypothetical protein
MATGTEKKVTIECPRCGGHGQREEWNPDRGICYRCRGHKTVTIRVEAYKRVLRMLRHRWVEASRRLKTMEPDDPDRNYVETVLRFTEADGRRVREVLESVGEAV